MMSRFGGAHPRVSGENKAMTTYKPLRKGSSPRERGKLRIYVTAEQSERLIPA